MRMDTMNMGQGSDAPDLDTLTASALLHLHTGDQASFGWTKEELEAALAATTLSQVGLQK